MNHTFTHTGTLSVSPSMQFIRSVSEATTMLAEQPLLRSKARQITVELIDGGLVLNGILPSYFLKQIAQETLRPLGLLIANRIHVPS